MRALASPLAVLSLVPALAAAKVYRALPGESTLTYVVVHPMHVVHGVNDKYQCEVELPSDPPKDLSAVHVKVSAKVKDFDSGNSNRDSHALEVLDALKYPTVEFESRTVAPEGAGYRVTGPLRFHGRERDVSFVVTPKAEGDKEVVTGEMAVKLSEFGVERPSLLMVPVKDDMRIKIKAVANR